MNNILTLEQFKYQEEQQDLRMEQVQQCKNQQELKQQHKLLYINYHKEIELNWQKEYKEQRGWGVVKPVVDLRKMAPLCKYPFRRNSLKGCNFCKSKRYWYDVIDPNQEIYALYFSMNLVPLWTKLRERWPHWTKAQVENNRYWRATKHKLLKELECEFLQSHPGPWCRALNRATGYQDPKTGMWIQCPHTTYTFAIWYSRTMQQIGIYMRWPPEPYPLTIQFVGRPKPGVDLSRDSFILSEETVKNPNKRPYRKPKQKIITEQEYADQIDIAQNLSSVDFE